MLHFNPRSLAGATQFERDFDNLGLYFNPRSLAGATARAAIIDCKRLISIHAPSRERHLQKDHLGKSLNFNPRSLAGATRSVGRQAYRQLDFNPRSLAGATC